MDEKEADDLDLAKSSVRRIAHSTTDRISDDAVLKIALQEEKRIKEKARLAELVADRAGRKTVREEDIMVVDEILSSDIKG
jgi:histone H3/H4